MVCLTFWIIVILAIFFPLMFFVKVFSKSKKIKACSNITKTGFINQKTRRSLEREKFFEAREFFLDPGVLRKRSGISRSK